MSDELDITGTEAVGEAGDGRDGMGADAASMSADVMASESADGTEPAVPPAEPVDDDGDAVEEPVSDTDTDPGIASGTAADAGDADDAAGADDVHGDDARDGMDGGTSDCDGTDDAGMTDEADGEAAAKEVGEEPTAEEGLPEDGIDGISGEPDKMPVGEPATDGVTPEDDAGSADNQDDGSGVSEEPGETHDECAEAPDDEDDADPDDNAETDVTEGDADAVGAEGMESEDTADSDGTSEGTDETEPSSDDDGDAPDDVGDSADAEANDIKNPDADETEDKTSDEVPCDSTIPDDAGAIASGEDAEDVAVDSDGEPPSDADEGDDGGDDPDGPSEGKPIDFMPDLESDEFREYSERVLRKRPIVALPHIMVTLVGILLACLFLALPFALDRAVSDADDALVAKVEGAFDKMGDEEREYRLALAQRHNALVSGWDAWPLVGDNGGKAGSGGSTSDDVWDSDGGVPDVPSDSEVETNRPLDVADGLIGWLSVPTGRKVAVCDSSALLDGKANVLRHERWSEWPVGGHGTACVLSLDDTENADSVVEDLLGLAQGDEIVLTVLGDSYAYKVDGIDSGTATSVMGRISKQRADDVLDILVQRGSVTRIVTAHRVRFSGTHGDDGGITTSPSVRRHLAQMVVALVVGIAASVTFVITWRAGREAEEAGDGQGEGVADGDQDQQER